MRDEREAPVRGVEGAKELVGLHGLVPEDVVGVGGLFVEALALVGIEDGSAEGDVLRAVAIATQRHVAAGEDEFELAGARFAEDGDALLLAKPADVVLELAVEAGVPVGAGHALEDGADEGLLVAGVEVAVDGRLGDAPVVLDAVAQEAAFLVEVIPREAHRGPLRGGEGLVEEFDEGFGGGGRGDLCGAKERPGGRAEHPERGIAEKPAAGKGERSFHADIQGPAPWKSNFHESPAQGCAHPFDRSLMKLDRRRLP